MSSDQALVDAPVVKKSPINDIVYGSTAGVISKLVEHPFDLIKVRLQSQPLDAPPKFSGPIDCLQITLKNEGVKGFWRGVSMPIVGAMLENATLFVVYNQVQELLRTYFPPPTMMVDPTVPPKLILGHLMISAALAGSAASFVLTPVELVKCKMQVQAIVAEAKPTTLSQKIPAPGPITITKGILRQDGIKGLWLGQTGTFIRETGGSAAWFTTFEVLTSYHIHRRHAAGQRNPKTGGVLGKGDLQTWELMSSGAAAGVIYNCLLFPVDCIKSTIQTEDELRGIKPGEKRRSFLKVGKDIYNARGVKGLYQGCGVTALRAAPSSALIFLIYSRMESYFG